VGERGSCYEKTAIFISMICFIVQPLLILANESPPPWADENQQKNSITLSEMVAFMILK